MSDVDEINPIIDNTEDNNINNAIKLLAKNSKEIKIATGFFFISGFNILQDELSKLREPFLDNDVIDSPFKIIMGNQTDLLTRDQIILGYKKELDKIKNPEHILNLSFLYDYIRNGQVDIRVYTRKLFHPKLYLFKNKLDDSLTGNRLIIGSSNFSYGGGTNNLELNLFKINDPCFSYLEKWFDTLWVESEEFKSDLIKLIEGSDLYKNNSNIFYNQKNYIYLPPILFFSNIIKVLKKDYLLETDNILLPFQEIDYKVSKDIIQKYGGVIIANSVGLGKSYIASKILSDYYKQNKKILLIIPPNLREQWVGYLKLFKVKIPEKNIVSMYELSQKDFPDEIYKDFDIVLIDEAHNFRNSESQRYKNFMKKIKNNKAEYILLTATPINNSLEDLRSQVELFRNENLFKKDNLFKYYNSLKDYIKKEDPILKTDITELRKKLIVKTTRRDLKAFYNEITIGNKGKVELREPFLDIHEYELSGQIYKEIYEKIVQFLSELELPHIKILNPEASRILIGLYKILLYKRLESSIFAFYRSLKNLEEKEKSLDKLLNKYPLEHIRSMESRELLNKLMKTVEEDETLWPYLEDQEKTIKDEWGKEELQKNIKHDLEVIHQFILLVERLKLSEFKWEDDKVELLRKIVTNNKDKKILLFTQFRDTADYLKSTLMELEVNNFTIDEVTGNTEDKIAKVIRFSPSSNLDYIDREISGKEIRFLISTDALSEGVNLQEADWIINYDLPWNPVRLIQRVGRVNRIGNNKDIYVHNFIPSKEFDKEIKLVKTLKKKINNIIEIIGVEHSILTLDEITQIRKKERDDVDIIAKKRELIRENKLDQLEEIEDSSKLSSLDSFIIKVSKDLGITKKTLQKIQPVDEISYTQVNSLDKGKIFLYSIDDGISRIYKSYFTGQNDIDQDSIPQIINYNSSDYALSYQDRLDVDTFYNNILRHEENKRKGVQHIKTEGRSEDIKRKIVRELQQTKLNHSKVNIFMEKASFLEQMNIPETYYKEVYDFYKKWIKDKNYLNDKGFIEELDSFTEALSKVSNENIKIADIKGNLNGFIIYK